MDSPGTSKPAASQRLSRTSLELARQYTATSHRISHVLERRNVGKKTDTRTAQDLKAELEMWEHKVTVEELCSRLNTSRQSGLTEQEASSRLQSDGPNLLSPPKVTPWYLKLLAQFTNFFAILLQIGSLLCFLGFILDHETKENLYLGIILYVVVVLTAIFTYYQEFKSEKTMEKFKNFLPQKSLVLRDGHVVEIHASNLVVGDVLQIRLGDKIPADIRIIDNVKLKVDNSPLTGESEPVGRTVDCTDENPLETNNLAFFGTLAVDGACTGIVVNTGDNTVFGRIAGLALRSTAETTTLQIDVHHFVILISSIAISFGIFFFVFGLAKGTPIITNIVFAIGLIVANVPEGLLATVTVSLTLSAKRLAKKHVLVKKLEAVETLGSTTCICSDKTGTLTQNRMSVVHVAYDLQLHSTKTAVAEATFDKENPCFQKLFFVGAVCGEAVFDAEELKENPNKPIDERKVHGDASEAGILKFCEKITSVSDTRLQYPRASTIPFNSANKFMVTIDLIDKALGTSRICMKGAPERVIDRCSTTLTKEGVRDFDQNLRNTIEEQMSFMMQRGERCLGFAMLDLDPSEYPENFEFNTEEINFPMKGLTFIGMMALLDPPREAVPDAVLRCQSAGVKVIMVTGDHPATAKAIAKQVHIISDPTIEDIASERGIPTADVDPASVKAIVVPGSKINHLEQADWDRILAHEQIVFARTSPQQKLIIVENVQRLGNIVAVTGDGVNDSPALKKANIGVAMGIAGSDVSKEAADMILLDDNFASIEAGVEEGRLIFDNLKKSIAYTLTHNPPEIIPFLAFIVIQIPQPLTTVLILCIDLGTDIVPAISLAYENAELDLMKRKPRNSKKDRLVNRRLVSFSYLQIGIMQSLAGFFTYLVVMNDFGLSPNVLPFLDRQSYISSPQPEDRRWLFVERPRHLGRAISAGWFDRSARGEFEPFFETAQDGFILQNGETSAEALAANRSGTIFLSTVQNDTQRYNMFKILAVTLNKPPCVNYSCVIDGKTFITSFEDCVGRFQDYDSGITIANDVLSSRSADVYHGREVRGTGSGEGCFDLYTVSQVEHLLRTAQTSFFVSIVIVQIAGLLICKTRALSLFRQGMKNWVLNASLVSELTICCLLSYVMPIREVFGTEPLLFLHWIPAIPFAIFILLYDETRKLLIRSGDQTGNKFGVWLRANTYW